jgi:hypothetical protein
MNKKYKIVSRYIEKLLSNIFFLFFVAQIFSPYIGNRTIYLELFIAIFNPYFLFWLSKRKVTQDILWLIIGFGLLIVTLQVVLVIKLIAIAIAVLFLFYAYERDVFYLKRYLILSILVAILQFSFLFIDPTISTLLGPQNISKTIWGAYATPSFTNFYTVFFIPRVSGLSREAGFFAAFLIASIFFFYLENKRYKQNTKDKIRNIFLWIGYILSFSKMSILIIPLIIVEKIKKLNDYIPVILTIMIFVSVMMFLWDANRDLLIDNETFWHRFSAYPSLFDIDLKQFLFGIDSVDEVNSSLAKVFSYRFDTFAGFGGFLLDKGVFITGIFLLILWITGISSSGILLLLLLTINVQPDTNQNFVVMTYFIIYKFYKNKRYILNL